MEATERTIWEALMDTEDMVTIAIENSNNFVMQNIVI